MRLLLILLALAALALSTPASAQNPNKLEEAKRLFREGNALREAGDCEGALARYEESRALVPSVPNVLNGAVCLRELGRYDEALEQYQDLITKFRDELTERERKIIGPAMQRLIERTGTIEVRANVTDATLMVDGRVRGKLPLSRPLRLLPGKREIRVLRDGYEPYDGEVEVTAKDKVVVDARLEPLAVVGRLRLDDATLEGADVLVDGAPVGTVPFDGALAAGKHWIALRRDDVGTAPKDVIIVEGQIASLALELVPLGPEMSITAKPATAQVSIGETAIGAGRWRGRLPVGEHRVTVVEEGYFTATATLVVTTSGPTSRDIALDIDEEHPRWGNGAPGLWLFEAMGGIALVSSMGSGIEKSCNELACTEKPLGLGQLVGASAAYEFPVRISVGLAGGYVRMQKSLRREHDVSQTFELTPSIDATGRFVYEDTLTLSGPFVGATLGYRHPLGGLLELRGNLFVGVVFGNVKHEVDGQVQLDGASAPVIVGGDDDTSVTDLLVMPELHLGIRHEGLSAGLGLAVPIFALQGPDDAHSWAQPSPSSLCEERPDPGCFGGQTTTEEERVLGRFAAPMPSLRVGYSF